MGTGTEYQIISHLCRKLPAEMIAEMENALSNDLDALARFQEIKKTVQESMEEKGGVAVIQKAWPQPQVSTSGFKVLLDKYKARYIQHMKDSGLKATTADLYEQVSGQSKWYRMCKDKAAPSQYHDDVRMICVLCRLNCSETIEFLWTTGHPLLAGDARDQIIAECIIDGVYEPEEVNRRLKEQKQEPLFTYNV